MMRRFAVVVPTLNPGAQWIDWVKAVQAQVPAPEKVIVIDSGSADATCQVAGDAGFEVRRIDRESFSHGGTRQSIIGEIRDYDFVVYLTQDAILKDPGALSALIGFFDDKEVAAVCGRQLPRKEATHIEAHARLYNYPGQSDVRSLGDRKKYGLKLAFLSNSFAAYRIPVLEEVGGFPENIIFGEDMYVAAKMLLAGYKIAYAADACVYHSHDYSILQELKRYFDMGVFHAREPWIRQALGKAEAQGRGFVVSEIKYLWQHAFWLIPGALLRSVFRYAGYHLGLAERYMPLNIKNKISLNSRYFKTG